MSVGIPVWTAEEIAAAVTRRDAVSAIEDVLRQGADIEADSARLFRSLSAGEFLLMPAESPAHAGVKVATVAPGNSARGLPKIHAWYLLFDAQTLRPAAILEGTYLTILRTPAVTVAALRALLRDAPGGARDRVDQLVLLGSGPQAEAHARTLADVMPVGDVAVVGRNAERTRALVERLAEAGLRARVGARRDIPLADVVVTATSSPEPVLDIDDVAPEAVVGAVGAHGPAHRELGAELVRGADLVVEARSSAFRESGNLLQARSLEQWQAGAQPVRNLRELVVDAAPRHPGRPAVYTGVGMSWEDLALAERVLSAQGSRVASAEGRETP